MSPTLEEFRRWLQGEPVAAENLPTPDPAVLTSDKNDEKILFDRPYLHKATLAEVAIEIPDTAIASYSGDDPIDLVKDAIEGRGISLDDVARITRSRDPSMAKAVFTVWSVVSAVVTSAEELEATIIRPGVPVKEKDFEDKDFDFDSLFEPAPEPPRKGPDLAKLKRKRGTKASAFPSSGKYYLKTDGTDAVLNFGKHSGKALTQILDEDPSYLKWMLEQDFPEGLSEIVEELLNSPKPGGIIPAVYIADIF